MNPHLANRILIALSILYGVSIAILTVLDSSAIGVAAIVGAMVLGALWAIRGLFVSRNVARRGPR